MLAVCELAGRCGPASCSLLRSISNTKRPRWTPNMWKSRAGSAVGWVAFRNGTLVGKLQPGQLQHRATYLLTSPEESFQAKGLVSLLRKRKKGDTKHPQLFHSRQVTLAAILCEAGQAHELPCLPAAPITPLSPIAPARRTRLCSCPQRALVVTRSLLSAGDLGFLYLSLQSAWSHPSYIPCRQRSRGRSVGLGPFSQSFVSPRAVSWSTCSNLS